MKISDQQLREKLLDLIGRKGQLSTTTICSHVGTYVATARVRETLKSLKEEGAILASAATGTVYWSLPCLQVKQEEKVMENNNIEKAILKREYEILVRKHTRRMERISRLASETEAALRYFEEKLRCL